MSNGHFNDGERLPRWQLETKPSLEDSPKQIKNNEKSGQTCLYYYGARYLEPSLSIW